jgi:hypothetical protein
MSESTIIKNTRTCLQCGQLFVLKNIAYERRGQGKYCSQSCARREYYVNENVFDCIDSEEKAYWLGFLMADGTQDGDAVILELQISDRDHLLKFKEFMSAEHPVKTRERENDSAGISIGSRKLCSALDTLGVVRNKSLIARYPVIPDYLDRHFIRGMFDGDGCMCVSPKGYRSFSIYSGSLDLLTGIHSKFISNNIKMNLATKHNNMNLGKRAELIKLKKFLYEDSSVFLERKYLKF